MKKLTNFILKQCKFAELDEIDPAHVGYDPSWGEHHGPVKTNKDSLSFGPKGYRGSKIPMPLPKKLYHVTLEANKILQGGFKTFKNPQEQTFGGHGTYVSFTTLPNAKIYAEGLKDMIKFSHGEYNIENLSLFNKKWGIDEKKAEYSLNSAIFRADHGEVPPEESERRDKYIVADYLKSASFMSTKNFPIFMNVEDLLPRLAGYSTEDVSILETETQPMEWSSGFMGEDTSKHYSYNDGETEWRIHNTNMIPKESIKKFNNKLNKQQLVH